MGVTDNRVIALVEEFNLFVSNHVESTRDEIEEARNPADGEEADVKMLLSIQKDFRAKFASRSAKMENEIRDIFGV